jgi:hypothetical protein
MLVQNICDQKFYNTNKLQNKIAYNSTVAFLAQNINVNIGQKLVLQN